MNVLGDKDTIADVLQEFVNLGVIDEKRQRICIASDNPYEDLRRDI